MSNETISGVEHGRHRLSQPVLHRVLVELEVNDQDYRRLAALAAK